jgi:hypothetical protein
LIILSKFVTDYGMTMLYKMNVGIWIVMDSHGCSWMFLGVLGICTYTWYNQKTVTLHGNSMYF